MPLLEGKNQLQSTETVGFKSYTIDSKGEKKYFVEGYIATYEKDLADEVISRKAMQDLYDQADTIKADLEHEAYEPDEEKGYGALGSRDAIIPIAKITDKKIDDKGVWVKAQLNHHLSRFKALWGSIQDGFLNAFSIAFLNPDKGDYTIRKSDGAKILHRIRSLLNVAITGNPINRGATFTAIISKNRNNLFTEKQKQTNLKSTEKKMPEKEEEAGEGTTPESEAGTEAKPNANGTGTETPAEANPSGEATPEATTVLKSVLSRLDAIEKLIAAPKEEGTTPEVETKGKPTPETVALKAVADRLTAIEEKLKAPVLKAEDTSNPLPATGEAEGMGQFIG